MSEPQQRKREPYRVSPFGEAEHPWLNRPDTKFNANGVFKVGVWHYLKDPGVSEHKDYIDAQVDRAFEEELAEVSAGERKKWSKHYPYLLEEDDEGNPTGRIRFNYKQNARIKLKGTEEFKDIQVSLRDAKDRPMKAAIWSGSILRVMHGVRNIKMPTGKAVGVQLTIAQVQVRELKRGGAGGGFGAVEGGYSEEDEVDAAHAANEAAGDNEAAPHADY